MVLRLINIHRKCFRPTRMAADQTQDQKKHIKPKIEPVRQIYFLPVKNALLLLFAPGTATEENKTAKFPFIPVNPSNQQYVHLIFTFFVILDH